MCGEEENRGGIVLGVWGKMQNKADFLKVFFLYFFIPRTVGSHEGFKSANGMIRFVINGGKHL